ncbi:HK97 family phage prohead protease [Candidatus Parcubacteria bacterium]|nr:HK97 family phage prohead protease [Candidatus Parcubacteria bacterium]
MRFKDIPFSIKAIDDGAGFEGYASVFGTIDRVGDIVCKGAFSETIPQFLKDGVIVWQHRWSEPIGKPKAAHEDEKGLYISAAISDTAQGRDCRTLMKDEVVKKLSFGYDVLDAEKLTSANIESYCDTSSMTAKQLEEAFAWGFALKRLHLYEVSPVSVPAHPDADITGVKAGPQAGRRFDDHSVAVLATVKDYLDRIDDLRSDRAEDGRDLSEEHRSRMKSLIEGLEGAKGRIEELLKLSEPLAKAGDVLQAHAAFLEFESRRFAGI